MSPLAAANQPRLGVRTGLALRRNCRRDGPLPTTAARKGSRWSAGHWLIGVVLASVGVLVRGCARNTIEATEERFTLSGKDRRGCGSWRLHSGATIVATPGNRLGRFGRQRPTSRWLSPPKRGMWTAMNRRDSHHGVTGMAAEDLRIRGVLVGSRSVFPHANRASS